MTVRDNENLHKSIFVTYVYKRSFVSYKKKKKTQYSTRIRVTILRQTSCILRQTNFNTNCYQLLYNNFNWLASSYRDTQSAVFDVFSALVQRDFYATTETLLSSFIRHIFIINFCIAKVIFDYNFAIRIIRYKIYVNKRYNSNYHS